MIHLIGFIFLQSVHAAPGFYTKDALSDGNRPDQLERALRAAVFLQRREDVGPNSRRCTGTVVSPEGYVLTALHCVKENLEPSGVIAQLPGLPVVSWILATKQTTPDIVLPLPDPKMRFSAPGIGAYEPPKVILVGKGTTGLSFDLSNSGGSDTLNLSQDEEAALREYASDFVILKFETSKPIDCIPLARTRSQSSRWAIGWPRVTLPRQNGSFSNGIDQYITYGTTFDSFNETHWKSKFGPSFLGTLTTALEIGTRKEGLDIEGYYGMSGGPVINSDGELTGILNGNVAGNFYAEYHPESAFSLTSDAIFSETQEALGEDAAREIFSCVAYPGGASVPAHALQVR